MDRQRCQADPRTAATEVHSEYADSVCHQLGRCALHVTRLMRATQSVDEQRDAVSLSPPSPGGLIVMEDDPVPVRQCDVVLPACGRPLQARQVATENCLCMAASN